MGRLFIAVATAIFALSGAAQATVVGIPFALTGDPTSAPGSITGTVTGTIFIDDAVLIPQSISSVAIDLDPSVTGPGPFPSHRMIDPVIPGAGGGFWTVTTNTVTFNGSVITSMMFAATWDAGNPKTVDELRLNVPGSAANFLTISGGKKFLANDLGLAALGPLAVPIPAALPLFLSGLVVLGFVARRRRPLEIA